MEPSAFPRKLTVWTGPRTVLIQGEFEMLGARCTQCGGLVGGSSVSSKVLGSSVAVPVNGLVSRLPAKKGCQDSKIKVKNSKTF